MRQMYIFQGIDGVKTRDHARRSTGVDRDQAIVHFHGEPHKCEDFKHEMYENGNKVDEWGQKDGSADPAQL